MYFFDLPKNIKLEVYGYYKDCGYEESLAKVVFEGKLRKGIEQDGTVYFLEYPDDNSYDEDDEDIPIGEPTPKVIRRKDLDLTYDELKELKDCADNDGSPISQKLVNKLILK